MKRYSSQEVNML